MDRSGRSSVSWRKSAGPCASNPNQEVPCARSPRTIASRRLSTLDEQADRGSTGSDLGITGEPSFGGVLARASGRGRSLPLLSALAKIELKARFDRGERPTAGEILGRFPELRAEDGSRVDQPGLRGVLPPRGGRRGPRTPADFCAAYAPWGDSLRIPARLSSRVEPDRSAQARSRGGRRTPSPATDSPRITSARMLGKGGAAHVYMAFDENLGRTSGGLEGLGVGGSASPRSWPISTTPISCRSTPMTEPTEDGPPGILHALPARDHAR